MLALVLQLLVFFSMWVESQFAEIPPVLRDVIARNKYISDKYAKEFGDQDFAVSGFWTMSN